LATQPSFSVRRLECGDAALFQDLNILFGEAFADADDHAGKRPDPEYLERLLATEHIFALVAAAGDELVGGLVAYELDKFEQARREIYIYDLAVREDWRRRGIATALINHLRAIGSERGAWMVFVQADYGDDPAIALYESLGTREEVLHFDIAVKPGGER
jgi:aminoglycoside 3-N-acetyltransferase I